MHGALKTRLTIYSTYKLFSFLKRQAPLIMISTHFSFFYLFGLHFISNFVHISLKIVT